ncbi:hypothetical protein DL762_003657 [Monosporascus cannonballus]|uniref:Uncharacterized protein n=1 Tax=Monosporascus cannonballus TaxID=155416 RepID=A0ABY0H9Z4_9PEZI|nr:hypothetical protein DL762_003657 [Monosporascus cannonballus]
MLRPGLGAIFAHGGLKRIGRKGFWGIGKPSVRKAAGSATEYGYDDEFVNHQINDGALGAAANALTTGMDANGLPNDMLSNLNSVGINQKSVKQKLKYVFFFSVVLAMDHVYPLLRRFGIKWGPISLTAFGYVLGIIGSTRYAVLQH